MCFKQVLLFGWMLCLPTLAGALDIVCQGTAPDWVANISNEAAEFFYLNNNTSFEIPQFSVAEGGKAATAYTLISEFDTAILLIDPITCETGAPMTAYMMTQNRGLPILLSGCCRPAE